MPLNFTGAHGKEYLAQRNNLIIILNGFKKGFDEPQQGPHIQKPGANFKIFPADIFVNEPPRIGVDPRQRNGCFFRLERDPPLHGKLSQIGRIGPNPPPFDHGIQDVTVFNLMMIDDPDLRVRIADTGQVLAHPFGHAGIHNDDVFDMLFFEIVWS